MREYHLDAELLHEFRQNGSQYPAYGSIVAAGANACVLHYQAGNALVRPGELVLIGRVGRLVKIAGRRLDLAEVEKALAKIRAHGKAAGILTGDLGLAKRYLALGATFVAIGNDVTLLANATTRLLADFKATEPVEAPSATARVY